MSSALSIAASGLKSQEYAISQIAHDLANLNTPNYKASKITFADLIYQDLGKSSQLGLGASVFKTRKDFSEGPLILTNNWSDLAIDGQGFFQVIDNEGNLSYTRNSNLTLDADRYLATQDGLRLADNIQIPEDLSEITIQKNGDVEAILADDENPQLLGTIRLAKFLDPGALKTTGAGLYKPTEQSGEAMMDNPGTNGLGHLNQKQMEGSNVDMVETLMKLSLTQRIYQLNAKAVQIADELEKMTNELRG
jgi:flagellar basal-body rod protein FlgG